MESQGVIWSLTRMQKKRGKEKEQVGQREDRRQGERVKPMTPLITLKGPNTPTRKQRWSD